MPPIYLKASKPTVAAILGSESDSSLPKIDDILPHYAVDSDGSRLFLYGENADFYEANLASKAWSNLTVSLVLLLTFAAIHREISIT